MPFNDGFSQLDIPYISPENSGSVIVSDGNEWIAISTGSLGTTGGGGAGTVTTSGNITGSGASINPVTLKNDISINSLTASNILVTGTGSIATLNVLNQNELKIGDKYITILSGAVDHATLDGSGILFGSGGIGPTVGDRGENAHILYRAIGDLLEIYPGLSSSFISSSTVTANSLYVTNNLSASTITGSFSGSFLGVNEVLAGANLTSSTVGALQTLALSSSVTGLNNLDSNNISASTITGSKLRITDDIAIQPFTSSLHEYNLYSISNHRGNAYFYQEITDSVSSGSFGNLNVRTVIAHTGSKTSIWGVNNTTVISTSVGTTTNVIGNNYGLTLTTGSAATASVLVVGTSAANNADRNAVSESISLRLNPPNFGAKRYSLYVYGGSEDKILSINDSGDFAIGKKDATAKLDISGSVLITGSINITNNLSASTVTSSLLTISSGSIDWNNEKISISSGNSGIVDTYNYSKRTARYTVMVETTTGPYHVQSMDLLAVNNGSTALITSYALVSTNDTYLASFDVSISGANVELTANNLAGQDIVVTLTKNYIS